MWYSLTGNVLTIFGASTVWIATERAPVVSPSVSGIDYTNPAQTYVIPFDHSCVQGFGDVVDWYPWDLVVSGVPYGGNCRRWFQPEAAGTDPSIPWTPISPDASLVGRNRDIVITFPNCGFYVIRASFCPQHNSGRTMEVLSLDFDCVADRNHDCSVTIDDLLQFLREFEAGTLGADVSDGNSENPRPDGGVDINDLLYFMWRFQDGC